jgi:LmbE family N-acetylglucosaminyl deacetylase
MDILRQLNAQDNSEPDMSTRPGVPIPGESDELEIKLTVEQEQQLVDELCDLVDDYELAMTDSRDIEGEIRDGYVQKFNASSGGTSPDSAAMASEMMMSMVDQAAARLTTNIMSAEPLMVVEVTRGAGIDGPEAEQLEHDTQGFANSYAKSELDLEHLLPIAILRLAKVGTSIFYLNWEEERRVHYEFSKDSSKPRRIEKKVGNVKAKLLDNSQVIVWPPTIINWQRGYQFVGHEESLTPAEWRATAAKYGLKASEIDEIASSAPESAEHETDDLERHGISAEALRQHDAVKAVKVVELWCDMILPGRDQADKFQVIFHRDRRKLLWIGYNSLFSQRHPYFPLRYKWGDNSAWGTGIGHEVLNNYSADTALWCLELDNLYAGAYWAILRRAGSIYNTQSDNPRPGMVIPVDDVEKDFKPVRLGGAVEDVGATREENARRAATATGLSSVMLGQGDPTMKSGAGTGSTNALIEQGNKKLQSIDRNLRVDLSAIYMHMLELVAQFAQAGIYYRHVDEATANRLTRLLYQPPRGDVSSMFQFKAQAPNSNSTDEARKQGYMMVWGFAMNHAQIISTYVEKTLQANNPAALPQWYQLVVTYLNGIAKKVIEYSEMPGVSELVPDMPQMTPQDQTINQQQQQIQSLTAQVTQAQQQLSQLAQQGMNLAGQGGQAPPAGPPPPQDPNAQPADPNAPPPQPGADPMGGMPSGFVQ